MWVKFCDEIPEAGLSILIWNPDESWVRVGVLTGGNRNALKYDGETRLSKITSLGMVLGWSWMDPREIDPANDPNVNEYEGSVSFATPRQPSAKRRGNKYYV